MPSRLVHKSTPLPLAATSSATASGKGVHPHDSLVELFMDTPSGGRKIQSKKQAARIILSCIATVFSNHKMKQNFRHLVAVFFLYELLELTATDEAGSLKCAFFSLLSYLPLPTRY